MRQWLGCCLGFFVAQMTYAIPGIWDGIRAYEAKQYEKAVKIFLPYAEAGESTSQTMLAQIYLMHKIEGHEKEGVHWAEKAIEVEQPLAFGILGNYLTREGHKPTIAEKRRAFRLYQQGNELGDIESKVQLGAMYSHGHGVVVEHDNIKAMTLIRDAARAGHSGAQRIYGEELIRGVLVQQDKIQGQQYLERAKANAQSQESLF